MSNTQNLIRDPSETQARTPVPAAPANDPAGPSGVGTFVAGVGANTIVALLQVMEDMMLVSNMYGELLVDQLKSQASVATSLGTYAKKQADDTAEQMKWQGWTAVAGGGLTSAIGLGGMASSAGTSDLDAEIQGAKSMRDYMDNPDEDAMRAVGNTDTGTEGATEKDIEALKNRSGKDLTKDSDSWRDWKAKLKSLSGYEKLKTTFGYDRTQTGVTEDDIRTSDRFKKDRETISLLDEDQLDDVKSTYDKKIQDLTSRRQAIANEHGTKWNTRVQTANALNSTLGGIGTGYGSKFTEQSGTEEAAKDTANAALQTAQGVTSETRQETETYLNKASEVVQLIAGISQANRLLGG